MSNVNVIPSMDLVYHENSESFYAMGQIVFGGKTYDIFSLLGIKGLMDSKM